MIKLSSPFRLAWASIKLAYARMRGFRLLCTDREQNARLNECDWCPELTDSRQCRICTCDVDAKTLLTTESCPLLKWKAIWVAKKTA